MSSGIVLLKNRAMGNGRSRLPLNPLLLKKASSCHWSSSCHLTRIDVLHPLPMSGKREIIGVACVPLVATRLSWAGCFRYAGVSFGKQAWWNGGGNAPGTSSALHSATETRDSRLIRLRFLILPGAFSVV